MKYSDYPTFPFSDVMFHCISQIQNYKHHHYHSVVILQNSRFDSQQGRSRLCGGQSMGDNFKLWWTTDRFES